MVCYECRMRTTIWEEYKRRRNMMVYTQNRYLITFTYKADVIIALPFYCLENERQPYISKEAATNRAKILAVKQTDKKFYVVQILNVTESVPAPVEPTITTNFV